MSVLPSRWSAVVAYGLVAAATQLLWLNYAGVSTVAPNNPPAGIAPMTDAARTLLRGVFIGFPFVHVRSRTIRGDLRIATGRSSALVNE